MIDMEEDEILSEGWTDKSPTDVSYTVDDYTVVCDELPEDLLSDIQILKDGVKSKTIPDGFIFNTDPDKMPQYSDIISINFTPDQLNQVINMMKSYSLKCSDYEEQGECRNIVTLFNKKLDEYAIIRPWNPFLVKFLEKIGRYEIRKKSV